LLRITLRIKDPYRPSIKTKIVFVVIHVFPTVHNERLDDGAHKIRRQDSGAFTDLSHMNSPLLNDPNIDIS